MYERLSIWYAGKVEQLDQQLNPGLIGLLIVLFMVIMALMNGYYAAEIGP
jgi:glycerol uptake facilitator-like aquaporin